MLPPLDGLTVWDIGCGWGDFAGALLGEGASHVIASDIVLDMSKIPDSVSHDDRITLLQGEIHDLAPQVYRGRYFAPPDLLFMHLMTEHVAQLPTFFKTLRKDVPPESVIFVHHDNYYQPTGHHDHPFLALNPATYSIEPQTVPCWTLPERCAASESHREGLASWLWGESSAKTVGDDCDVCNYKLRSEPWAHLVHQNRFTRLWPEPIFSDVMNKVTSFQVRQHLIEAGFDIVSERRTWIGNEPSAELISQFTKQELQTFTITFRAVASVS